MKRLGYALTAISFIYLGYLLYTFDFGDVAFEYTTTFVLLNLALIVFHCGKMFVSAYCWHALLSDFLSRAVPWRPIHHHYIKANIAKYLPGNVFHFVSRQMGLKKLDINQTSAAAASIMEVFLVFTCLSATCLVIFLLGYYPALPLLEEKKFLGLLLFLSGVIVVFLYLRKKPFAQSALEGVRLPTSLRVSAVLLLNNTVANTLFYLLCLEISGASFHLGDYIVILSALYLSFLAGFIIPGSPGGIGVRESAIVLLTASLLTQETALSAALITRLHSILGELAAFLLVSMRKEGAHVSS